MKIVVFGVCLYILFTFFCLVYVLMMIDALKHFISIIFTIIIPSIFVLFIYWTYYKACTIGPGYVPLAWAPEFFSKDQLEKAKLKALEKNFQNFISYEKPTYCIKCAAWKPERAHHCKDCNKCILKMDHHCPFINGCVGHYNHKYFILFLFYCTIGCSYCWSIFAVCAYKYININWMKLLMGIQTEFIIFIVNLTVLGGVTIAIGSLFTWQIWVISNNCTTIETYEHQWTEKESQILKKIFKWKYDLGSSSANWQVVFGDCKYRKKWNWYWLLPLKPDINSGLNYESMIINSQITNSVTIV
eukprot:TRINITY_DN2516_c0_g1_i2.p1 TRINITY_DN2516_c0_g1~~TRINITY_DN2516_c0_g1_i2.p1  ORF type:complete len:301 (+),score=52.46 TRINITY_DN2516_c0_g1_i2:55-957(+)